MTFLQFILVVGAVACGNVASRVDWLKHGKKIVRKIAALLPGDDEDELVQ